MGHFSLSPPTGHFLFFLSPPPQPKFPSSFLPPPAPSPSSVFPKGSHDRTRRGESWKKFSPSGSGGAREMKKRVGGLLQSAEGESGRKNSVPPPSSAAAAAVQRMKLSPLPPPFRAPLPRPGTKDLCPLPFPLEEFRRWPHSSGCRLLFSQPPNA